MCSYVCSRYFGDNYVGADEEVMCVFACIYLTCVCVIYLHTHTFIYMYVCVCTYTHTHTHTHTQLFVT
jgi:hypothetical protein